jgi:hypothetical protein
MNTQEPPRSSGEPAESHPADGTADALSDKPPLPDALMWWSDGPAPAAPLLDPPPRWGELPGALPRADSGISALDDLLAYPADDPPETPQGTIYGSLAGASGNALPGDASWSGSGEAPKVGPSRGNASAMDPAAGASPVGGAAAGAAAAGAAAGGLSPEVPAGVPGEAGSGPHHAIEPSAGARRHGPAVEKRHARNLPPDEPVARFDARERPSHYANGIGQRQPTMPLDPIRPYLAPPVARRRRSDWPVMALAMVLAGLVLVGVCVAGFALYSASTAK